MNNFLSKYKSIFYSLNIIVIILYLFPGSLLGCLLYSDCKLQPQITRDFIVSSNHLYAFFVLSMTGFFTYKRGSNLNILILYLLILSIILELLHLIIPVRSFELSDLFGNLIGVLIAILINFLFKIYEKFKN
ncbi:hypothetical protein N8143_01575 [Pelagibacteraceae bacterium]|nr:hypothetical protein [Pelagibacteraceae bacterium]